MVVQLDEIAGTKGLALPRRGERSSVKGEAYMKFNTYLKVIVY
jgi:hypothetical protein